MEEWRKAVASNPAGVGVSAERLRQLDPNPFDDEKGFELDLEAVDLHLRTGDSRAAVVVSTSPLRVAAYTDELDCVVLLAYSDDLVAEHGLELGSRLLTFNTYDKCEVHPDLDPGPLNRGMWGNFFPLIAEFFSDDAEAIARRKAEISGEEWERAEAMGQAYLARRGLHAARDGRPSSLMPRMSMWPVHAATALLGVLGGVAAHGVGAEAMGILLGAFMGGLAGFAVSLFALAWWRDAL